ncbi:unnamed protein product [Polarella glacialis]|uniref:Uncharacterized protein n=1 Tax=Polarella glacialis TaxID=89957 RepID=A0A813FL87_POLGL|nr:unnamed protein product [Polarella glacialis]CAE8650025.1 unnamed protein product [Polarella glacialis]
MSELLASVDDGSLSSGEAQGLSRRGADLRQALAYAASTGRIGLVLMLAEECGVRMDSAQPASNIELMRLASDSDWASVAYFLACSLGDGGSTALAARLQAKDADVRRGLRRAAGVVNAKLPYDMCVAFTKTGRIGPDLFVEQPRWLLPRPKRDELFLTAEGAKLPEGWYSVVQYPLGDELRQAVLRRRDWGGSERQGASALLAEAGETLLCKAAKTKQWELVRWMLQNSSNAADLALQLELEWHGTWDEDAEWCANFHDQEDLAQLCACLESFEDDSDGADGGIRLSRPWHRGGAVAVPAGALLRSPRAEVLREALALGTLALEALRRVGATEIRLALPPECTSESRKCWLHDLAQLASEDEGGFGTPLVHHIALAGQTELLLQLLDAMAPPDARDRSGLTALAVAARAGRWEACEALLEAGCRADGRTGAMALGAAQRASRAAGPEASELQREEAARAAALLDKIYERQQRPPAATLTEFFQRQVCGELMHGIAPRKFQLSQARLSAGPLEVWARAVVVGAGFGGAAAQGETPEDSKAVVFAALDSSAFEAVMAAEALDVSRLRLLTEAQLLRQSGSMHVVAVAVSQHRLAPEGGEDKASAYVSKQLGGQLPCHYATVTEWRRRMSRPTRGRVSAPPAPAQLAGASPSLGSRAQVIRSDGTVGSRFAAALPVLARALPTGTLRVESVCSCCQLAVGRVDIVVDNIRLGETPNSYDLSELDILVPPRELEVATEFSGRRLACERLCCTPLGEIRTEVSVGVYVYIIPIDEDCDMVFVAGHRRDLPDEAKAFCGEVAWPGGQERVTALQPLTLGSVDCLGLLRSLALRPDLRPGQRWEATEWEDTSTPDSKECQFRRLLVTPVRIGNIVTV